MFSLWGYSVRVLCIGYFSKSLCKPAKFLYCSFAQVFEWPAQEDCIFVSCWAFSLSSPEQVLGGTYINAHGEPSGFFCLGVASCVGSFIPRGHPMLLLKKTNTLHYSSSGKPNVRRDSIGLYRGGTLTQQHSLSLIKSTSSYSDFQSAACFNTFTPTWVSPYPCRLFLFLKNTSLSQILA